MVHARHIGAKAVAALADLIWPPRSLIGDAHVHAPGVIDADNWSRLTFLGPPWCAACGWPFDTPEPEGTLCGVCVADASPLDAARAAIAYDEVSRALALDLKHGGRRDGLATFAGWMAKAAAAELAGADVLVPVPLHWTRLLQRRFNQSALLAQALAKRVGKPVDLFGLKRTKRRRSQGGLTASERLRNVRGVFRAGKGRFAGLSVALIDDVYTTGATAEACARALKRAGATKVSLVALARVVRPSALHI